LLCRARPSGAIRIGVLEASEDTLQRPDEHFSTGVPAGAPSSATLHRLPFATVGDGWPHALPPPLTTRRPSATSRQDRVRDTGASRAAACADSSLRSRSPASLRAASSAPAGTPEPFSTAQAPLGLGCSL